MTEYQAQFYISADGISREVITTDICRYLGNNARIVKPNMDSHGKIIGYYYVAYRAFTDEMVRSLQEDSARWRREKERNTSRGITDRTYAQSVTSNRHHPGDYFPEPIPIPVSSRNVEPESASVPKERYVYDHNGVPYYDLERGVYIQPPPPVAMDPEAVPRILNQGIPQHQSSMPPAMPNPVYTAPQIPTGYWTIDQSGRKCYVENGRIIQYA